MPDISAMSVSYALNYFENITIKGWRSKVAERIIKFLPEINDIKSVSYLDLRDIKL